jgi:integrase
MTPSRGSRRRGNIEPRGGGYRVRVYAGFNPITKKHIYLRESIPPGPHARREAERALTRLQAQLDDNRAPRMSASLNQLLDRYFEVGCTNIAPRTRSEYMAKAAKHIRPFLGDMPIGKVDVYVLESLYTDLRQCREHCHRRRAVDHRTSRPHECDEHGAAGPCRPFDPDCRACRRMCKPHQCKPFADSGIRAVHFILRAAFGAAIRWGWTGTNPVTEAKKPPMPSSDPRPPTSAEAARLVNEAWRRDVDWGVFVWTAMTLGARRGELCALRWDDIDLDNRVVEIRRAISLDGDGHWYNKDTKTHQHRRVVLDQETTILLAAHRARCEANASDMESTLPRSSYVFSRAPDQGTFLVPDTVTQRYDRMAARLGIKTTFHKLRHYSATELLNGGMDVRAVAGRLGHGSGGAMTLRAYAAWLAEADQRAAPLLAGRMPALPADLDLADDRTPAQQYVDSPTADWRPPGPYAEIARDLRGAITCGVLRPGDELPTMKDVAERYGVAPSTAHQAFALLKEAGYVEASRGRRAVVRGHSTDRTKVGSADSAVDVTGGEN